MERERVGWLQENIGEVIQDVRFANTTSKPIAVIIDNQNGKSEYKKELLEKEGFVVFSPRNLSEAAVENMGNWTEHLRNAYLAIKLPSCLMIVDPTQEERSRLLARTIIEFYNEIAGNYKLLNKSNDNGEMIPAFEGIGDLGNILASVGFIVQKSDEGNKITVKGKGFSLTVDGQSGEITENPIVNEDIFEGVSGKNSGKGIGVFRRWFRRNREEQK